MNYYSVFINIESLHSTLNFVLNECKLIKKSLQIEVQGIDGSVMDMTISKMLSPVHALDVSGDLVVGTSEVQNGRNKQCVSVNYSIKNHYNGIICINISKIA